MPGAHLHCTVFPVCSLQLPGMQSLGSRLAVQQAVHCRLRHVPVLLLLDASTSAPRGSLMCRAPRPPEDKVTTATALSMC